MDFSLFRIVIALPSPFIEYKNALKKHHHWISSHGGGAFLMRRIERAEAGAYRFYLLYIHVTFSHPSFLLLVTLAVAQALPPLLH